MMRQPIVFNKQGIVMERQYKTVYEGGEGEITEKKSRFIATVIPCEDEETALAFIEATKKKYELKRKKDL